MNKKKLIIILAFLLSIFALIYFLLPESSQEKIEINLAVIQSSDLENYKAQISQNIFDAIKKDVPTEVEINIITVSNNGNNSINIKMKPFENQDVWLKTIKIHLDSVLASIPSEDISDKSANDIIVKISDYAISNKDYSSNYYFITGMLPICYNETALINLKENYNQKFEKLKSDSKFFWSVVDVREKEEIILNELIKQSFTNCVDKRIIIPNTRNCIDEVCDSIKINLILLSPISDERTNLAIEGFKNLTKDKGILKLNVISKNSNYQKIINLNNSLQFINDIKSEMNIKEIADRTTIKVIFNEILTKTEKDSSMNYFFILGDVKHTVTVNLSKWNPLKNCMFIFGTNKHEFIEAFKTALRLNELKFTELEKLHEVL